MSKKVIISKDKEAIKHIIFDGHKEDAIKLCRIIKEYGIYEGFAGFGLYLTEARSSGNPKKEKELAAKLTKAFNGQKEETHRVWIVLQEVMKWMAGQATDVFKAEVDKK